MEIDQNLKILLVGDAGLPIYARAFYSALLQLGYTNTVLFDRTIKPARNTKVTQLLCKLQNKFTCGPLVHRKNKELFELCREMRPDLVFIYNGINIFPSTIREIKKITQSVVFSYNNDDPFADFYSFYHWRHYKKSIPVCDYNFVYRKKNIDDIRRYFNLPAEILRSYYLEDKNHPVEEKDLFTDIPDVLFLGHYEEDERCEYMQSLIGKGIHIGVPSEHYPKFSMISDGFVCIENERNEYNRYLASCKIPLIFFSKINHDTYTRRCFEIPAAGALILSPYTEDMVNMFEEDKEAVFFRNKEEFVEKVLYYLSHEEERRIIAAAGRERLLRDGHEVKDRVKQFLNIYKEKKYVNLKSEKE